MILAVLEDVAGLVSFGGADLMEDVGIPSLAQADRLGIGGGRSVARPDAVEPFDLLHRPDSQPGHAWPLRQQGHLFVQSHQGNNVVDAFLKRQVGVLKRILVLRRSEPVGQRQQGSQHDRKL